MRTIAKLFLVLGLALGPSVAGSAVDGGPVSGTGPSFKHFGPLALGPDGVVFAGDAQEVSVYALELKNALRGGAAGTKAVDGIDRKIASLLGTDPAGIAITDVLVYGPNRNTLISVMRGQGADAQAALIRVDGEGRLTNIPLAAIRYSKVMMPNPPPPSTEIAVGTNKYTVRNYPDRPQGTDMINQLLGSGTITDMAFDGGKLYVTGLSNEAFASKLRVIPYPFKGVDQGTGVEIWHGAHGQFETRSPINTFVPYTVNGERHIIASYTCTPLVKFPVSALKPGVDVRGVTIGEFGNGNRPLDMVVYSKGGQDFILMSNNRRGVMKVPTSGFAATEPILKRISVTDRIGVVPETVASLQGVEQLDKLDEARAIMLTRNKDAVELQTVALP